MNPKPYHIEPTPAAQSAASDFILDSLMLHVHTRRCQCCGQTAKWSILYEVYIHRTRIGLSGLRRLVPARLPMPYTSVTVVELDTETTPACHLCVDTLPQHQVLTTAGRASSEAEWAATLKRKYESPRPLSRMTDREYIDQLSRKLGGAPATPPARKHIPSASDL